MEVDETTEQQERLGRITANTNFICGYRFDTNNKEWCELDLQLPINSRKLLMVDIVEKVCHQSVIRHIPRINRCFVSTESPQDTRLQLMTEGENLQGVHEFADTIDVNQVYSNDIAAILRIYGVEAARSALIKEIAGVFGVYGIQVDTRHLTLVADYMTFDGGYRPFNRIGIEGNASPFAKMSFETTMHFLTKATTYGEIDTLKNPSARLVVGKVVESGTGAIDILQPFVVEKVNT
jgi:DNA-directed RNA polymerase I subunit RPA1